MKILIVTQAIDEKNPVLGFFCNWVEQISRQFDFTSVVCLMKGENHLSSKINVLSLGKEKKKSRLRYIFNFYRYIWIERKKYDVVFVHMNQEYVILGGILWFLLGKKIYMWRNHYSGSIVTDISSAFCKKIFSTSKLSYTAKYKRNVLMPVGIDLNTFRTDSSVSKIPLSILSFGRISPSKNIDVLVEALRILNEKGVIFKASIFGDALERDEEYLINIKKMVSKYNLENRVTFHAGVTNNQAPQIYNMYKIFINLSPSGMLDKTIFEAMACGNIVLTSNDNLKGKIPDNLIFVIGDAKSLAKRIEGALVYSESDINIMRESFDKILQENSLSSLSREIRNQICSDD